MDGKSMASLVEAGVHPVVEFGEGIVVAEGYLEPGMRGRLVGVRETFDDVICFSIDITEFETHNRYFERRNYYDPKDRDSAARLTAREAGYYPKEGMETLHVGAGEEQGEDFVFDQMMAVLDGERLALFERYRASGSPLSYTAWLEEQLLSPAVPA